MLKEGGGRGCRRVVEEGERVGMQCAGGFPPRVSHKHIKWVLQMMVQIQLKMFINKIYLKIK